METREIVIDGNCWIIETFPDEVYIKVIHSCRSHDEYIDRIKDGWNCVEDNYSFKTGEFDSLIAAFTQARQRMTEAGE